MYLINSPAKRRFCAALVQVLNVSCFKRLSPCRKTAVNFKFKCSDSLDCQHENLENTRNVPSRSKAEAGYFFFRWIVQAANSVNGLYDSSAMTFAQACLAPSKAQKCFSTARSYFFSSLRIFMKACVPKYRQIAGSVSFNRFVMSEISVR